MISLDVLGPLIAVSITIPLVILIIPHIQFFIKRRSSVGVPNSVGLLGILFGIVGVFVYGYVVFDTSLSREVGLIGVILMCLCAFIYILAGLKNDYVWSSASLW